jgi:AAA family ATPase
MNCGVGIGEMVTASKFESSNAVTDASQIDLIPITSDATPASSSSSAIKELFLKQAIVGQYLCEGHTVTILFQSKTLKYRVTKAWCQSPILDSSANSNSTSGEGILVVRVTLNTKISVIEGKSSSKEVSFDEESTKLVGGLSKQIEELKELVEMPLMRPEVFEKYGMRPPRGVLLYGPPGTGKTLLAKVMAKSLGAKCLTISAPEVMSKYYGESEAKLKAIWDEAEASSPALIFIDEIDAIAPKRDSSESEVSKRIVGALLTLMDGINSDTSQSKSSSSSKQEKSPRVVVLAATNRPNALDPALRRPGRFDREIEIPIPNEAGRAEILQVYMNKMRHSLSTSQMATIAGSTHGYVGADLSNLCKEAALCAFKRAYHTGSGASSSSSVADQDISVTMEDVMHAMAEIRPSAMREIMVDIPKVKWDDIGGYEEVKEKLKQAVEWPLQHPEAFRRLNIQPTRGVLLYGPPGCSKTLLAKAVATQAGLNFIPIKGPELFSKYVGESERAVREVFRKARAAAPAIIFFDEIDAIGGERGQGADSTSVHDRVLAQMLNELDGIEPLKSVLFLAATNRPDIIDKALMRPGRIDQAIFIAPPDASARKRIFEISLKRIPHADDVVLDQLVTMSSGFSGAEVTSACREAGLAALQEDINATVVHHRHFATALASIVPTITPTMMDFYTNFANRKKS